MKDRLIKKSEDEIQALNHELKLELPKEIKRARELGDLRENAEYHAAKERQRLVEARIGMLQKRVSEIALINVDRIPKDRAGFGSTLHGVESTGEELGFQLVMPGDADTSKGLVSTPSPIGGARRLWEDKGFWRAAWTRSLYAWRWAPRLVAWALAISLGIVAVPLAVAAAGLLVFPIDFVLKMIGLGGAPGLLDAYLRTVQ